MKIRRIFAGFGKYGQRTMALALMAAMVVSSMLFLRASEALRATAASITQTTDVDFGTRTLANTAVVGTERLLK